MPKILVIGASGQIGSELTYALQSLYGVENIIASDIRMASHTQHQGIFEILDATDKNAIKNCVKKYGITEVYLMAALLSAMAERHPAKAWELNMNALFCILDLAKEQYFKKVFWPSSIAVFGPSTPRNRTPQHTITAPSTVYGISKLAGEQWCEYYHKNYNVDVRSLRYPGLISWKTPPGGGTTDYAVAIYHNAVTQKKYECFLGQDTMLPMMYMDDAVSATIKIMKADAEMVKVRSSYNIASMSFSPKEIAKSIQQHIPDFKITYQPDFRQNIADSWPKSICDQDARTHWGWIPRYDLEKTTTVMLSSLEKHYKENADAL